MLAAGLALPLLLPAAEKHLANFSHTTEFFIAIAGFTGTVLVLAFSLAIIPIQRAAEAMPVSVVRLFSRDSVNAGLFVVLALLCILSFCLAVYDSVWLPKHAAIPVQIVLVGLTFDLIRWHHRHTVAQLEPSRAIQLLLQEALKLFRRTDRRAHFFAKIQRMLMTRQQRTELSHDQVVGFVYNGAPNFVVLASQWIRELEEAGLRSLEQGETRMAVGAIDALAAMGGDYLVRRRNTLIPIPVDFFSVLQSDLRAVLTPIYESLTHIGHAAIRSRNERAAIRVVQAFGALALTGATLKSPRFHEHRAPLGGMPIAYLERCVLPAVAAGLHDVGLEATRALLPVSRSAPPQTDTSDVHTLVTTTILKITAAMLAKQLPALANVCLEDYLRVVHGVVTSHHHAASLYLQQALEEATTLLPLAVEYEQASGANLLTTPLGPLYALTSDVSLGHIFTAVAQLIDFGDRRPYSFLEDISDQLHRHFRYIAERVDLKKSSLTWHMTHTIRQIADVYMVLVANAQPQHQAVIRKLAEKEVPWHLSFCWAYFSKAKTIELSTATETTEVLGGVALKFADIGVTEIVESAVDNIGAVTVAFAKLGNLSSQYDIGDLLRPLLCVERFANATGGTKLLEAIEKEIADVLEVFVDEDVWAAVDEAIDVRRRQVASEVSDRWAELVGRDRTEGLLARMLSTRGLV